MIGEVGGNIVVGSGVRDEMDGMSGFDRVTGKDHAVGTSKGLRVELNINLLTQVSSSWAFSCGLRPRNSASNCRQ